MKQIKGQVINIIIMMIIVTLAFIFLNSYVVPSNYEDQSGAHIWLSSSTIKYTNNWLKEGPMNLKFIMYEAPASIEFNDLNSRGPYISYPPGCIIPPYLIAKILGKSEIGISFIKHMLDAKYLLDCILVCLIIYSILTYCLKLTFRKTNILISIIISMFWMILPNNLYYFKNVYFSDQLVITVVLLYVLLEIFKDFFENSNNKVIKVLHFITKFLVILFGVLVDYYFLFVVFISFLIKIIPSFFKHKEKGKYISIIKKSIIYVIPVITGISLFLIQLINVQNFQDIIVERAKVRLGATANTLDIKSTLINHFVNAYSEIGILFMILVVTIVGILMIYSIVKYFKKNYDKSLSNLIKISLIIYIPPVLQIIVLKNHSAIHEFSMLKFGLPFVFGVIIIAYIIFKIYKIKLNSVLKLESEENKGNNINIIKVPGFGLVTMFLVIIIIFATNLKHRSLEFYKIRYDAPITYELENLIKENSKFEDVFISYTYEINTNPPMHLSVSNKLVYKIDEFSDINKQFPSMNENANVLFVIEKNNDIKTENIIKKEKDIIDNSDLVFQSANYYIYKFKRGF
ncbi:MAG: hypothetical protein PHD15_03570 [Clostridia bacterium]|nr:hypothetical protein [Clostridia bacterium]MDD4386821.1 hypothetical protein [Clostridia bacterium]